MKLKIQDPNSKHFNRGYSNFNNAFVTLTELLITFSMINYLSCILWAIWKSLVLLNWWDISVYILVSGFTSKRILVPKVTWISLSPLLFRELLWILSTYLSSNFKFFSSFISLFHLKQKWHPFWTSHSFYDF